MSIKLNTSKDIALSKQKIDFLEQKINEQQQFQKL